MSKIRNGSFRSKVLTRTLCVFAFLVLTYLDAILHAIEKWKRTEEMLFSLISVVYLIFHDISSMGYKTRANTHGRSASIDSTCHRSIIYSSFSTTSTVSVVT